MPTNYYMYFLTALIPLIVGSVYYSPKVMGGVWMRSNGFTEESLKGGNMALILALAYFLGLLLSVPFSTFTIHQAGVASSAMSTAEPGVWSAQAISDVNNFMATYGDRFRTFKHGALHGVLFAILVALPLYGINALFERRGAKYVFVHLGYWVITLALMGGVLCSTLEFPPLQ